MSAPTATPGYQWSAAPLVFVDDGAVWYLEALEVEQKMGPHPGHAICKVNAERFTNPSNNGFDGWGPSTLNMLKGKGNYENLKVGQRIKVKYKGVTIFDGFLTARTDTGGNDEIIFKALDYRCLLNYIPVRGQVVLDSDPNDPNPKFISARATVFNPGGHNNCILTKCPVKEYNFDTGEYSINTYTVPMFSDIAYKHSYLEKVDADYSSSNAIEDVLTAWTPRRALTYLAFITKLMGTGAGPDGEGDQTIPGINDDWRSLASSKFLQINWEKWNSISGTAGDELKDPLDRKLNSINVQGMTWAGAVDTILKISGTHLLNLVYESTSEPEEEDGPESYGYSELVLTPTYLTAQNKNSNYTVNLQVSGRSTDNPDNRTVYEFETYDDFSNVASSLLIESDSIKVEGVLSCEKRNIKTDWTVVPMSQSIGQNLAVSDTSAIRPAWSSIEEQVFRTIIQGDDETGYAKFPTSLILGDNEPEYVNADGNDGRPLAHRWAEGAVTLARSVCPNVFKKFWIDSTSDEVKKLLKGVPTYVGEETLYDDLLKYPRLKRRGVEPRQLQYIFCDPDNQEKETSYSATRYPVRLSIKNKNAGWEEGGYVNIQPTADLCFFLDLAESKDGEFDCIYTGNLYASSDTAVPAPLRGCSLKEFKLNIAVKLDHLTRAIKNVTDVGAENENALMFKFGEELGGEPLHYIHTPGFSDEMQVGSNPAPVPYWVETLFDGTQVEVQAPLTRRLPGSNTSEDLEQMALRRIRSESTANRSGTFKMVGTRVDIRTGTWIESIMPMEGKGGVMYQNDENVETEEGGTELLFKDAAPYPIEDNIHSVKFDFNSGFDTTVTFRPSITNNI